MRMQQPEPTLRVKKRSDRSKLFAEIMMNKYLYVLALPGVLWFLIFKYLPMWGILIAFKEYSPYTGFLASPWVGLEHFERFFSNPRFLLLLRNTLMINFLNLVFFFPMPILLSLLLNELRGFALGSAFKRTIQSIVYLPHFLSWVIIGGITFIFLGMTDGLVNKLLVHAGYNKFEFLTNADLFWGLLTAQSIWKEAGWGTIIFLAAIAGTDQQLYEAARIDGAGRVRQAWHVTLPAIRHVIIILLILRLGNILDSSFDHIYVMTNSAVSDVSDVFETYVFRMGIQQGQFSFSTAAGLFNSVVGLVLVVIANRVAKKFEGGVY